MFAFSFGNPASDDGLVKIRSVSSAFITSDFPTSQITVPIPPNANGDMLLLFVYYDPEINGSQAQLPSVPPPSGWTEQDSDFDDGGSGAYDYTVSVFYKTANSEGTELVIPYDPPPLGAMRVRATLVALRNATTIVSSQINLDDQASFVTISSQAVQDDDLYIAFAASNGAFGPEFNDTISFTESVTTRVFDFDNAPPFALGQRFIDGIVSLAPNANFTEGNRSTHAVGVVIRG